MLRKGFKRNLLLLLATFGDFYSELSLSTFYRRLYYPDYNPRSTVEIISKMAKVEEIEKEVRDGEVVLRIKTRGLKLLDESISLAKLGKKKWDGVWRIVIFDIPEKNRRQRDILREHLKRLGFGKWQKSVYITPHPMTVEINEFLQSKNLFPRCVCLESRQTGIGDDRRLASFVFKLDKLNRKYLRIAEEADFILRKIRKERKGDEPLGEFRKLWEEYQEMIFSDPYLPADLLPEDWAREEARENLALLVKGASSKS